MSHNPSNLNTPLHPDDVSSLQREIQRLLGRSLWCLQQYEYLLKAIVTTHELAGPIHSLEEIRDARIQGAAKNTLGALIAKLFGNYIVTDSVQRELLDDVAANKEISLGFRINIQMTEEDYARTHDGLKELLDLSNRLVHHFIAEHDLRQMDACIRAREQLLVANSRIDWHFEQLKAWAQSLDQAQQQLAAITQSPAG